MKLSLGCGALLWSANLSRFVERPGCGRRNHLGIIKSWDNGHNHNPSQNSPIKTTTMTSRVTTTTIGIPWAIWNTWIRYQLFWSDMSGGNIWAGHFRWVIWAQKWLKVSISSPSRAVGCLIWLAMNSSVSKAQGLMLINTPMQNRLWCTIRFALAAHIPTKNSLK